jgi:hypothetical protein
MGIWPIVAGVMSLDMRVTAYEAALGNIDLTPRDGLSRLFPDPALK